MHEHSGGTWLQHFRFVYWFGRHKPRRDLAAWMFFFFWLFVEVWLFCRFAYCEEMWRTWQEACQRTKASLVFFFSCPTKKEFLTQAGRVLNTHPSGLATRQAVRNLVVLRSLSWTLKRKTRQNSPGKYGETAQVKQLVWLFGVIKTHRNMTWQKEWAVDGSSQLVLTGAMVKTWVNCSYWGWSIRIWILYPAEGFLLWDGWP